MTGSLDGQSSSSRKSRKWTLVALAWTFTLGTAGIAYGVPRYAAGVRVEQVSNSPSPVFLSSHIEVVDRDGQNIVIGQKTRDEIATASFGRVRGSSNADYLNVSPSFPIFSGSGDVAGESSDFILDNLVLTGPPGNILVSFNFTVSGSLGATIVSTGSSNFYLSDAHVEAFIGYQSSFGGAGFASVGQMTVNKNGVVSQTGIFGTFPVDNDGEVIGSSPPNLTFVGDPSLQFGLRILTTATAAVGFGAEPGSANGHASFTSVIGLPSSGPVANLPPGYNLYSTDGLIFDNRLVVPEPLTPWAAILGWTAVVARRRSQSPRRCIVTPPGARS